MMNMFTNNAVHNAEGSALKTFYRLVQQIDKKW